VTLLPPRQFETNLLGINGRTRGNTLYDGKQTFAVRFPSRNEGKVL
jgi:hypothetical protein